MKNTYLNRKTVLKKNLAFMVITIFLILLSAFFISQTVQSMNSSAVCMDERYYQDLEKNYVKEVRAFLNEQGFENSGVTLTRVVDADGSREYSVTLHHKYLEILTEQQKGVLFSTIADMAFQVSGCTFVVELLG